MVRDDTDLEAILNRHDVEFQELFEETDHRAEETVRDLFSRVEKHEDRRPNPEEVVEAAAEYFTGNVGKVANPDPIVRDVTPDDAIEDLPDLRAYQFLSTGTETDANERAEVNISEAAAATTTDLDTPVGVRDFLCLLGDRLRTIDTAVTRKPRRSDDGIRGRIDWQRTLKSRAETGQQGGSRYVCRVQDDSTISARNRVLLDLLLELRTLAQQYQEDRSIEGFPEWLRGWERRGRFRTVIDDALSSIHFSGVDVESVTATERDVFTTRGDRDLLYREAAALSSCLREIRYGDSHDGAAEIFGMDVFLPDQNDEGESTIYELYWHFELVDSFASAGGVRPINLAGGDDLVASWVSEDDNSRYLLFHDWDGTAAVDGGEDVEYLQFAPPDARADDGPPHPTTQPGYTHQAWRQLRDRGLGKKFRDEDGTPDMVLIQLDMETEETIVDGVFVGEVKHTDSAHTVDEGLAQLAEYGAFVKIGDGAEFAGETNSGYLATESGLLDNERVELGLFVSSQHQVAEEPDGIQLSWFDGGVDRPLEKLCSSGLENETEVYESTTDVD